MTDTIEQNVQAPQEAIAKNGRTYGYWCRKRQHVWIRVEDAEKCCHPDWSRALSVRPGSSFGVDVLLSHYWLKRDRQAASRVQLNSDREQSV